MIWKTTERVQTTDALFLNPRPEITDLMEAFAQKPRAFMDCEYAFGQDWSVVLAARLNDEIILPRLENSIALYTAYPGIRLPVGVILNMPENAARDYAKDIRSKHAINDEDLIIIPETDVAQPASDLYIVKAWIHIHQIHLQTADV